MRRTDRQIQDADELNQILKKALVMRIAMVDGDRPYMIPVNFGISGNAIYFHGAPKGKKWDVLAQNPHVCFEVEQDVGLLSSEDKACNFSMRFRSIIGQGTATMVTNADEKKRGLEIIISHYSDNTYELSDTMVKGTAVARIDIESMTGKKQI